MHPRVPVVIELYAPAAHNWHVTADIAPIDRLKVPGTQDAHIVAPSAALNRPASQNVHTADVLADATSEKRPALQVVHICVPEVKLLNLPATHAMHTMEVDAVAELL